MMFAGMVQVGQTRSRNSAVRREMAPPASRDGNGPARSRGASHTAGFDFSHLAIHAKAAGAVPTKSSLSKPDDPFERTAETAAGHVMNASPPLGDRRAIANPSPASGCTPARSSSHGIPLSASVRDFMEPRFNFDFSRVRVHTDGAAAQMSRGLNAQAFAQGDNIYYGAGRSPGVDALTAHELAHVVQQAGGHSERTAPPAIQRVLEVRPPGPHDASAFDRRDELIDRLNTQSPAIQYFLDGQVIEYTVIDESTLTEFDRRMQGFIDQTATLPMRLTTGKDRVRSGGGFVRLTGDSFGAGNVDLDDLLADDDSSFRSDLVHFLTERASVRGYATRMGRNLTEREYQRGHRLGKEAEAAVLRDVFHDPSIQFNYDETRPNNTWLNNFVSHDHHYQVFQVVAHTDRDIAGGEMFVRLPDGTRVTMEDFKTQRDAAVGAP
jgi:Domain of unknown function (DUF4157)